MRELVDSFPVGAATSEEFSLEDEIKRSVNTITLVSARLLMFKAQDRQRKYECLECVDDRRAGARPLYIKLLTLQENFHKAGNRLNSPSCVMCWMSVKKK
jgi:hypothetical protein